MNTDRANATLRIFWAGLTLDARQKYRAAWRNWEGYMARQGTEPTRVTVPLAQDWVNHLARRYAPSTVARHVAAVRSCLQHLAMMGHRPYEPLTVVEVPTIDIRPPKERRPQPTVERLLAGMRSAEHDDRALAIMWATAGMGLASREVASLSVPGHVRNIGSGSVAAIQRGHRKHLIPIPRELAVCAARSGWPLRPVGHNATAMAALRVLRPHLPYNLSELRSLHLALGSQQGLTEAAIRAGMVDGRSDGLDRWQFSRHPAVAICAHLRSLTSGQLGDAQCS